MVIDMDFLEWKKRKKRKRFILKVIFSEIVLSLLIIAFIMIKPENMISSGKSPGDKGHFTSFIKSPNVSGFMKLKMGAKNSSRGSLILVNNNINYQFDTGENDLVSLYERKNSAYHVKDKNIQVSDEITEPLNQMLNAFEKKTGLDTINIVSGYRTYDYQKILYDERMQRDGEKEASKSVALPGGSEHHTGLAIDLGIYHEDGSSESFDGTGEYGWFSKNAYQYGFIVRYNSDKNDLTGIKYEPWHLRYVGLPHSYIMKEKDFCLEEYMDFLREFEYGKKHLSVEYDNIKYEIYYVPGKNIHVPKDKEYTISGNNMDGFIVTILLNK